MCRIACAEDSPDLTAALDLQDSHQLHEQQKLRAASQELVAKNLALQIENEELSERLAREVCNHSVSSAGD